MKKKEIISVIKEVVNDYFEVQGIDPTATEETPLFGSDSELDSLGLINVIVDIESYFRGNNIVITLTSAKAMSRRDSPFKTIDTLAEFIEGLII